MSFNPFAPPVHRDTPEQIDLLHGAGYYRSVEVDGIGMWQHAAWPMESWTGAEAALTHAHRYYEHELRPKRRLRRLGRP
jgi:hypothetical protein